MPKVDRNGTKANEVPHVTLCVANGGKAVDAAKRDFVDCEPFEATLRLDA